ncbi:MAG: HIT domain-containing protein [Thaumarchaeota archaeon]|nr:HIT domain-containing protein [Nitrososphaerota archaeon]MDE1872007.1 HIT domain-containing protein [Nitrososphaerota archaeon]
MDCIFCSIVSGKIPARKIHESPKSVAFLDAFPLVKGHTLVIPKTHYSKIQEMTESDNADLFEAVRIVTGKIERLAQSSLVAVHNGKESGQEIPHVHVHVIPRKPEDGAGPVHSMFTKRPKLGNDEFAEIENILKK